MSFLLGGEGLKNRTSEYWKKRFIAIENASNTYGQQVYRQIESTFDIAQNQIQKEIESWYGRYARNNNITMTEARRQLSTTELKEFRWDVKEYIKYGRENDLNQMWMKELENASARVHVSRLEALKVRTQHAAEVAFGNELDAIDDMARKVFTEDYYHSCFELQKGFGIGWEIGQIDERKLETLISKPWAADGKNFSERIWGQRTQLVNELHQQLTRTCVLGKAPDDAIKAISKKFGTTKTQAGRLVMTEQAYFHSVAQEEAFNDLDVEEFEVVATLDSHTSEICQEMDGQHFPMKDYQPGSTAPPFHVWCRSVTVPYFEDNFTGERAARDEDGNTYYVPDNMTYKDWKKSMVDGDTGGLETLADDVIEEIHLGSLDTKDFDELSHYMKDEYGVVLTNKVRTLDFECVRDSISGVEWTMKNFPETKGYLKKIDSNKKGGVMNCTGNVISCSPTAFSGHYYSGNHEFFRSTGVHESVHMVEGYLIDRTVSSKEAFVEMWDNHSIARQIVKEAFDNLPTTVTKDKTLLEMCETISSYASTNSSECIAEAVSDVYKHGDDASNFSLEIFKILKKKCGVLK